LEVSLCRSPDIYIFDFFRRKGARVKQHRPDLALEVIFLPLGSFIEGRIYSDTFMSVVSNQETSNRSLTLDLVYKNSILSLYVLTVGLIVWSSYILI
jgi:hypothetical protein